MARHASGSEHINAARELLKTARTADELRLAQSVLLPLELGLSIEQTARVIGRSSGATCTMRTRFGKVASGLMASPRSKRQLRNRANADLERERAILDEVLTGAVNGGVVIIPQIKPAIEAELGKTLALSSVYRMLDSARVGASWPQTLGTPKATRRAREDWKKIPWRVGQDRSELWHNTPAAPDVPGRSPLWPHQRYLLLLGPPAHAPDGQGHAHPSVHLRLRRRLAVGRAIRLAGAAARQHRLHAVVYHRDRPALYG